PGPPTVRNKGVEVGRVEEKSKTEHFPTNKIKTTHKSNKKETHRQNTQIRQVTPKTSISRFSRQEAIVGGKNNSKKPG
ncbi:hypothetical protein LXA26_18255, partial [Erwinia amylovora]|uniref:hypothetical protein n=1 Tax=Erwinia amylovora TaxID=552 RepID=UPI0020BED848